MNIFFLRIYFIFSLYSVNQILLLMTKFSRNEVLKFSTFSRHGLVMVGLKRDKYEQERGLLRAAHT